jgi:hypothetical protein
MFEVRDLTLDVAKVQATILTHTSDGAGLGKIQHKIRGRGRMYVEFMTLTRLGEHMTDDCRLVTSGRRIQ